jgi:hypothetical protein
MFVSGSVYWVQDNETRKQESLGTKDRSEPFATRQEWSSPTTHHQPTDCPRELFVGDPEVAKRAWQFVMDDVVKLKKGETLRSTEITK